MSHRAIAVCLLVLLSLASLAGSVTPATQPSKPEVKVSIAVREGMKYWSKQNPLQVVIENTSERSQAHFDEWNSWGYFNLTFTWTDSKGNKGAIEKVERGWDKNFPSATVLQPGEVLVREISFDPAIWRGLPKDAASLTIEVLYQSRIEKDDLPILSAEHVDPWIGTAKSKSQAVTIQP